jgi:microcystin-dependent protein
MAFTSKDDAINNMNSNITTSTEPHLTPVGSNNRVRATNLKNWLTEFLQWVFPTQGTSLKGKSPVITSDNTNYSSVGWVQIIPTGTVMPWAGSSISPPEGYLFCDDSVVSDSTYPDLFAVIGNIYGSAPSGQFRLPNLKGKVPLGFDSASSTSPEDITNYNNNYYSTKNYGKVGNIGGNISVPLKVNQLATHDHGTGTYEATISDPIQGGYGLIRRSIIGENVTTGSVDVNGSGNEPNIIDVPKGANLDITGVSGNRGNNEVHENRMPYVVMKYIIKT